MTADDKWKLDRKKYNFLIRQGNSIFVVWETDWKYNKNDISNKLKNWYETNKNNKNKQANLL